MTSDARRLILLLARFADKETEAREVRSLTCREQGQDSTLVSIQHGLLSLARCCFSRGGVRECVCACTCACSQVHLRCNTCMHSCALLMCLCDSGAFLPPAVDVQTSHPCTGRLVHRQECTAVPTCPHVTYTLPLP